MTKREFTRMLGQELCLLDIPFTPSNLQAFVGAEWPFVQKEPEVGRWAQEYISQVVTLQLEDATVC